MKQTVCSHPSCPNAVFMKKLCQYHYGVEYVKKHPPKAHPFRRTVKMKRGKKIAFGRQEIKKMSVAKMKKELDVLFSPVVRMTASNDNGICACVTCGATAHWTKLQNGHFLKRSLAPALIFEKKNCHPQDVRCNVFLDGNYIEYTLFMQRTYGESIIDLLKAKKLAGWKPTAFEMEVLIKETIREFLEQCARLNHEPTKNEQKVIDKYTKSNS